MLFVLVLIEKNIIPFSAAREIFILNFLVWSVHIFLGLNWSLVSIMNILENFNRVYIDNYWLELKVVIKTCNMLVSNNEHKGPGPLKNIFFINFSNKILNISMSLWLYHKFYYIAWISDLMSCRSLSFERICCYDVYGL